MKKGLICLFVFIAVQVCLTWVVCAIWLLLSGVSFAEVCHRFVTTSFADATAPMIITATAVYSIVLFALFVWRKWSVVSLDYLRTHQWWIFFWAVVTSIGTLLPSVWLQEQLPELPNNMEDTFSMIMDNNFGYLTICIFAPLVEELVFRGAILRSLLDKCTKHWYAILVSAMLFSIVHANPAQMPHAFIIGLLLGWIYYRTGSILPGVVFHWVNNTVAFLAYRIAPETQDQAVLEIFNGNQVYMAVSIILSLLILLLSIYQLNAKMKK